MTKAVKLLAAALCFCITGAQVASGQSLLKHSADNSGAPRVRWISHRGHESAPENTLSAYRIAAEKGYQYVECDVRFTKDMVPVLIHDAAVGRTSDGSGLVKEYTYGQLLKFDFGCRKASRYKGERIPSLDSFLELCSSLGLHPYIDVKEADERMAAILCDAVKKRGLGYSVTWIGAPETLSFVKNQMPGARLGIIIQRSGLAEVSEYVGLLKTPSNTVFIDARSDAVDSILARWCRDKNIILEAWDVSDMAEARRLISMGVTGITGDIIAPSRRG